MFWCRSSLDLRFDLETTFWEAVDGSRVTIEVLNRKLTIVIPAGIQTGQRLRLTGEGDRSHDGARVGDLYVVVSVQDDLVFTRDGFDLYCSLKVRSSDLARGAVVDIPPRGKREALKLNVPRNTPDGTRFRVRSQGVPVLGQPQKVGDLYVTVEGV